MGQSLLVRLVAMGLTLSCWTGVADGQPKNKPLKDLFGDPLPGGVVARFGSVRLRHADLAYLGFRPDGKTVMSAGGDGVIRFWDAATGQQIRTVNLRRAHPQDKLGSLSLVTLSADGKTLAAQVGKQHIILWEIDSGKEIASLGDPLGASVFVCFSPRVQELTVGYKNHPIHFWEWKKGVIRFLEVPKDKNGYNSLWHGCFSPDGKWFVVGGWEPEQLAICEARTGRVVRNLLGKASALAISQDSKHLAVVDTKNVKGDDDTVLRLFDLATGKNVAQFPLDHPAPFHALTFSPNARMLVCSSAKGSRVLECATARTLVELPGATIVSAFSPDGKTVVTGTDWRLRMWEVATGKERHAVPGDFTNTPITAISQDGRFLASTSGATGEVSLWETATGRLLHLLAQKGAKDEIQSLSFSPNGRSLVACLATGILQFWDVASGKKQRIVPLKNLDKEENDKFYYLPGPFYLSPDGKHVFRFPGHTYEAAAPLSVWETARGTLLHQRLIPKGNVAPVWLPDGSGVVLPVQKEGQVLADIRTGAIRTHLLGGTGCTCASRDGRFVAGGAGDGEVGVWETATGQPVAFVHTGPVAHYVLGPDNRTLITTNERFLSVWDLVTGKERHCWDLPDMGTGSLGEGIVRALLLSPDGRRVFTVMADGTALAWDLTPVRSKAPPLGKGGREQEIAAWWNDLAGPDAQLAYAAVWRLAEATKTAIPWLRKHLKPVAPTTVLARKWVADLGSKTFAIRVQASHQLKMLRGDALPALREGLEKNPSLEVRRRLEVLLEQAPARIISSEELRRLRALQVLEQIASLEARRLLEELAGGWSYATQTQAAKAALERLARR